MKKAFFISLVISLTLYSCIKAPSYSVIPHIDFKSVSSSSVHVLANLPDTITFSFTDGDGDIGVSGSGDTCNSCGLKHGDSACLRLNSFNVFLIDSRDSCVATFASANVQPTGKYKDISGEIQVITGMYSKSACCFAPPCPGCSPEHMTFGIILRDMAGHFSNTAQTTQITVDPN